MSEEDRIWREGLKRLAKEASSAGPSIERRLTAEFRKQHSRRFGLGWLAACIAAGAVVTAALVWGIVLRNRPTVVLPKANAGGRIEASVHPARISAQPGAAKRLATRRRRQHKNAQQSVTRQSEAAIFFALPYAAQYGPMDRGAVVRVSLPRSAMAVVGLPVNPDHMFEPIHADVVVGEDGVARAIRFVQYP